MAKIKIELDKVRLEELYVNQDMTTREIAEYFDVHYSTVQRRIKDYDIKKSYTPVNQHSGKKKVVINDELGDLEKKTLNEITKAGYSLDDIKEFIKGIQKQQSHSVKDYSIGKNHAKFILTGDKHLGHIQFDKPLNKLLAKVAKDEKVDFIADTGDIFDGWYQNRPSSIFEQNAIGFDQQMKLAVEEIGQYEVPFIFITGNHSYNTFVRGAGIEAGPVLEDKLKAKGLEAKYLGNAEGDIHVGNSLLRLLHPDGGSSYAISYKSQKIIESLESGKKPNVLGIGHFHKAEYIFYRNIHTFQTGTLCGQTKFMKGKGLAAHKGFWLIDMYTKDNGQIDYIIPRLYPAYK